MELQVTPVFEKNYDCEKKIVVNRGGTRSSKTVSIMQLAVLFLFTGYVDPTVTSLRSGVWSTVRKYSSTLDKTVIRDFEEILTRDNLWERVKHNKTAKTYIFAGRMVEFIGADDSQKLRGSKRAILHCNEGNELNDEEWKQLIFRTTHKAYIDFNPDDEGVWINTKIEQERAAIRGDVEVIVSTYKDNTFLEQTIVDEIEYLEKTDELFWKIYGLGQYGSLKGLIFDWKIKKIPDEAVLLGYGQDFGFTNDPTTLTAIYKSSGDLFFKEMIYERGLTNDDICERYDALGLTKTDTIIADSAEPKSIEEIKRKGWNIHGAKKGADSIKNGIDILKRFNCFIDPESVNIIKEYRTYKWEEDKNGVLLNKPVDFNNHAIDGIRYFALNKLGVTFKAVMN